MARLESQAVAGFFKTPTRILPMIAALFDPGKTDWILVDPCAGEGEAALTLAKSYVLEDGRVPDVYTCELEKGRHAALKEAFGRISWKSAGFALHGDSFRVDFGGGDYAGLLYLNPPYDTDLVHGRLEQRWLERFAEVLQDGGRLAFVVPHHALAASARFIALEFDEVRCFRFPEPEFADYKQVVLVARKCPRRLEPDAAVEAAVLEWSTEPVVPDLEAVFHYLGNGDEPPPEADPELCDLPFEIPARPYHSFSGRWRLVPFDAEGMAKLYRPMRRTSRTGRLEVVAGILPDLPISSYSSRTFPVATPPRPAHLAAGIAAGLFNGKRVSAKVPGLPDLLVKGTFDRDYVRFEEKKNEKGETIAVTEAQQPRLTITVLDLSAGRFHTLRPGGVTGAREVAAMTIEDLLDAYGPALARVMHEQCPATYDAARPDPRLELVPVARPLFEAQADAGRACLGLMGWEGPGSDPRGAALLLGEIGVGKTSVAIACAKTIARRPLVMCPPHLLGTWRDEVAKLVPGARVRVLSSIADVDAAAVDDDEGIVFNVLSREVAKLGHGYEGVERACPGCGQPVVEEPDELARRRMTCDSVVREPANLKASLAARLAVALATFDPKHPNVRALIGRKASARHLREEVEARPPEEWPGLDPALAREAFEEATHLAIIGVSDSRAKLFARLALEVEPELLRTALLQMVEKLSTLGYSFRYDIRVFVAVLPEGMRGGLEKLFADGYGVRSPEDIIERASLPTEKEKDPHHHTGLGKIRIREGAWSLDGAAAGSLENARAIFELLCSAAKFEARECGERLYQAAPAPRRFPLATYIVRRHPRAFDMFINDEAHESQGFDSSAQGIAAARLSGLHLPTLRLTGSVMNGYAESLFGTMWLTSPTFREEFGRGDLQRFLDRYGYRKRVLSDKDKETKQPAAFGSSSDRVVRSERVVGNAPGVLPLFLFRHLLRCSVTLHRSDLKVALPPCRHVAVKVKPGDELGSSFKAMFNTLVNQIRRDQFGPRAGQLFGALSEVGSYLDRATSDTGNVDDGSYVVAYPDGEEVARGLRFDPDRRSAKEAWLLGLLDREIDEGRNVLVFTWHENLMPRIARVIREHIGFEHPHVPMLVASKVPTSKRQDWIDREVVAKGARVLVANPATVQTGLNNLVHFNTQVFHENPACNPIIARQAVGRIDRLGARKETRVYWPVFAGTIQEQLHALMLRKVAISTAADGLDVESVLIAAGGSDDPYMAGMSLGKQLLQMLEREEAAPTPAPKPRPRASARARLQP